jgi:four helix bundle protein
MATKIVGHGDLDVYRKAMEAAMRLYSLSKTFPPEERFSLTDQARRSSRSICANLAEAWRKRVYEKAFVSKISDCEGEAAETQVWIEFAVKCGHMQRDDGVPLYQTYEEILRMLVAMRTKPENWIVQET